MTASESHGKLRIGTPYYQLSTQGSLAPVIETWRYDGYRESPNCNSASCDRPYFFYHFVRCYCGEGEEQFGIRIPSLVHAERTFLTWDELFCTVTKMGAKSPS
jgi:hypothetical protein